MRMQTLVEVRLLVHELREDLGVHAHLSSVSDSRQRTFTWLESWANAAACAAGWPSNGAFVELGQSLYDNLWVACKAAEGFDATALHAQLKAEQSDDPHAAAMAKAKRPATAKRTASPKRPQPTMTFGNGGRGQQGQQGTRGGFRQGVRN